MIISSTTKPKIIVDSKTHFATMKIHSSFGLFMPYLIIVKYAFGLPFEKSPGPLTYSSSCKSAIKKS